MSSSVAGGDISPPRPARHDCEVLVVGGGPSGAAAAYWLASAGYDVLVAEKKHFPRAKTCGDGLTPRSVRQLDDMGLAEGLATHHRYDGLRALAFGKELVLRWPDHPDLPSHGYVVTRADLDLMVANRAEKAGATLWQGVEAVRPLADAAPAGDRVDQDSAERRGAIGGAILLDGARGTTTEVHADYVVVADGANSRFGRAIGAARNRALPMGLAIRGYYRSPRHDETLIESHLDIRDRDGSVVPGYGWIFPLGDGRVNVGIGLLSTFDRWKNINTSKLMASFVDFAPRSWGLDPSSACGPPTGGKLPMGLSIGPRVGPDYLLVGDAAGAINPFNGEGIAYGYETGRLAAAAVGRALSGEGAPALALYDTWLEERYGLYFKVASAFMRLMGRPDLMRLLVNTGMYSQSVMEWLLRIMANILRPEETGPAEAAYRAAAALARRVG